MLSYRVLENRDNDTCKVWYFGITIHRPDNMSTDKLMHALLRTMQAPVIRYEKINGQIKKLS